MPHSKAESAPRQRLARLTFKARKRHVSPGVTLIEVLIVVAIMAMIAGGVAMFAIPAFIGAQQDTAKIQAKKLIEIASTWQLTMRESACPTLEQLKASKLWSRAGSDEDPWGTPYRLHCDEGETQVQSLGPDKLPSTKDDIFVPPMRDES